MGNIEEQSINTEAVSEIPKVKTWQRISNILHCLSGLCLEINESAANQLADSIVHKELNAEKNSDRTEEYEQELKDIFINNKIDNSEVQRIINGCTQSVIFGPFFQLMEEYFKPNGFNAMRDVRTERGWVIEVQFNQKGGIMILHKRQAQYTLPPDEVTKHFVVNWELDMSFTPKMEKCCSAIVRVRGIEFHDDVDADYKSKVEKKLTDGD